MVAIAKSITTSRTFHHLVLTAIVLNAVLLGVETSRTLMERYGVAFSAANWVFQAIFIIEIVLRLIAFWPRVGRFFLDGWNVFDFVIVAASLLPMAGSFATVARLARLLRVARLVSASEQLRLIVATMLRSIPSMVHVILLLAVLLYVYGVAGVYLFRDAAPEYFGTLGKAILSLFQVVTLEGWAEMQAAVLPAMPWAWIYFATFIVIGVFVVINLFIAVVINNLEKARQDEAAALGASELVITVRRLREDLERLEQALQERQ